MNQSKALIHYSSPYYDPAKAHEYYEKHKKLKGRTSSSTTAKQQASERKSAASLYVKKQIENKMKKEIETYANKTASKINILKDAISQLSTGAIKTYNGMNKEKCRSEIQKLREDNAKQKKKLQESYAKIKTQELAKISKSSF